MTLQITAICCSKSVQFQNFPYVPFKIQWTNFIKPDSIHFGLDELSQFAFFSIKSTEDQNLS